MSERTGADGTDGTDRPTDGAGAAGAGAAGAGAAGPTPGSTSGPAYAASRPTPIPGDRRPGQRLDHVPGERYAPAVRRAEATAAAEAASRGSIARSAAFAAVAAVVAAALYFFVAGVISLDSPLVLVGILSGFAIGLAAKFGGAGSISRNQTVATALVLTIAWFVGSQVVVWLYARSEGGDLPIVEYALDAFGPIVPLAGLTALLAAWWAAR